AAELLDAYRFLRRIENRIQMENELQVYRLPGDDAGRRRLARAFGSCRDDGVEAFESALQRHRDRVLALFSSLFDPTGADRILDLFQRNVPYLVANPATRALVENLAAHLAAEVEASSSPQRATHNLDEFIRGVGKRKFFYELLLDRPE